MKKTLIITFATLVCANLLFGQSFLLQKPNINSDSSQVSEGLPSNGITQMQIQGDSTLWFGTGGGLSKTTDFGTSFLSYLPRGGGLPRGGISSLAVHDSIVWTAAVGDSSTDIGSQQTGRGLAYSADYGDTWTYIPQPIDSLNDEWEIWGGDSVKCLPVVSAINNTTWDIALTEDFVYIVSWAGGLRRSSDFGQSWQRVPLPTDDANELDLEEANYEINPRDPSGGGNHNHKGFSVLAYGDTVWAGTANGVNFGVTQADSTIHWTKYNFSNSGLPGNFIVGLHRQLFNGVETIWAVCLAAEGTGEYRAIGKFDVYNKSWATTLAGERCYSVSSYDSVVYVSSERGLFKSVDGENWALYEPMENAETGDRILSEKVYTSLVDTREDTTYLWCGTGDGIAKTDNDGIDWTIKRAVLSTKSEGEPEIYAYPNPFAPTRHNIVGGMGFVRIQYYLESPATVFLEVYDFAMDLVYRGEKHNVTNIGDNCELWNGASQNGELVANGVYFCKLTRKTNGNAKSDWTKLIIIK